MHSIFEKLLSNEAKLELTHQKREFLRTLDLPDRFLAEELLRLTRSVRCAHPELEPHENIYDNKLFWHIIPEAAKRLGATKFRANERTDRAITQLSNPDFRTHAGHVLIQTNSLTYWKSIASRLLLNEPINGNVLVFALDRICAPINLFNDPIAKCIRSAADARGVEFNGTMTHEILRWTPQVSQANLTY